MAYYHQCKITLLPLHSYKRPYCTAPVVTREHILYTRMRGIIAWNFIETG